MELELGDEPRLAGVIHIVRVIGEIVGDVGNLRLDHLEWADRVFVQLGAGCRGLMLAQARADFPRQVEPRKIRIALLDDLDGAAALKVVVESALILHEFVQCRLADVAEWTVADVVRESDGLGQVFVGPHRPRDRAAGGGHLHRVSEAGAVVIGRAIDENLGFVFQPTERLAVQDAVAVARVFCAVIVEMLGIAAAERRSAVRGIGRKALLLDFLLVAARMNHGRHHTWSRGPTQQFRKGGGLSSRCHSASIECNEFRGGEHAHGTARAGWKVAAIAGDECVGLCGHRNFQKRLVVMIGEGVSKRNACSEEGAFFDETQKLGDQVRLKLKTGPLQYGGVFPQDSRVHAQAELSGGDHADDLARRREGGEQS